MVQIKKHQIHVDQNYWTNSFADYRVRYSLSGTAQVPSSFEILNKRDLYAYIDLREREGEREFIFI